jgi:hypothetical protein
MIIKRPSPPKNYFRGREPQFKLRDTTSNLPISHNKGLVSCGYKMVYRQPGTVTGAPVAAYALIIIIIIIIAVGAQFQDHFQKQLKHPLSPNEDSLWLSLFLTLLFITFIDVRF